MRAYLDHASTSPLRPETVEAMLPFLTNHVGDPARLHEEGRMVRGAIETAREQVAAAFGSKPREVVICSSGTEANNAAVFGALHRPEIAHGHVITTAVEHSSMLEAAKRYAQDLTVIGCDANGRVDPGEVIDAIRSDTALVSVQLANHEVGTVQVLKPIAAACKERDILFHIDACAAVGYMPVNFAGVEASLMSITAHKSGGPQAIGALLIQNGVRLPSFIVGGAQERARRGGIENTAAIVGFGAAVAHMQTTLHDDIARYQALTQQLRTLINTHTNDITYYGDPEHSLPSIVAYSVNGVEAEPILLGLDQNGVAAHSGSSCSSETLEPSTVLQAMSAPAEQSLRFSVGWSTTEEEIELAAQVFSDVVAKLRSLR